MSEDMRSSFCPRCLPLVCGPDVLTIHVLQHGLPICGFERSPGSWPEGHTGVEISDWSMNPNCQACVSVLNGTHKPKTYWDRLRENLDEEDPS